MTESNHLSTIDIEHFDQFIEGYSPYADTTLDLIVGSLASTIKTNKTSSLRICEVGSASGQFSAELERCLEGKDASFFGLDIAGRVLALYPFHKIRGSAFRIPVSDGAFDVVCYPASLHHLAPFSAAVAEMSRVLAPGGYVYCIEPNFFHPQRRYFMRLGWLYRLHCNANDVPINPYDLEDLFDSHGIKIVALRYINIEFRKKSILQRIQNFVASLNTPPFLDRFLLPWFIMTAIKENDRTKACP